MNPVYLLLAGVALLVIAGLLFLPIARRAKFFENWRKEQEAKGWPLPKEKDGSE